MKAFNLTLNDWKNSARTLAHRMDWYRGLRAATALSTPLLLADVTGLTHLGWTALGGIEAIVADAGGPYRARLGRLSVLTLGGAAGVFLGTLAGNDLRWALPVTLLFTFLWAYLPVLGQPFASAALLVQVIYACGIGEPDPSPREALLRAGFLLAGGAWAMLLSLFLWPLDPYRPARASVGDCYHALAVFLRSIQQMEHTPHTVEEWRHTNPQHKIQLRRLLEKAWEAVASVRAENPAETAQGRHLIVLLETADLILGRTVALAEHTEATGQHAASAHAYDALDPLQIAEQSIATLLIRRKTVRPQEIEGLRNSLIEPETAPPAATATANPDLQFLAQQLKEIALNLDTALESTAALRLGTTDMPLTSTPIPADTRTRLPRWDWQSVFNKLADNWRFKSLSFRHAARVAIVCGFDVCLIQYRHVGHGYWLLLTSVVVLQPHVSGTLRRGMQRIGGTVGGGILAALLAIALHSELVTGIVLFPLALLALALLPVSYAGFAFFITPAFVLAFLRHPGDWQLAILRVGNTIAGAAISIAAMTVLFPTYERERIANYLRASLVANRRYLEQLIENWKDNQDGEVLEDAKDSDPRTLALARRATGLAHNDMEESLERVLAERWTGMSSSETLLAFAAYLHRFSQSITGLANLPGADAWKSSPEVQAALGEIHSHLLALESLLNKPNSTPNSETDHPHAIFAQSGSNFLPGERQLERLERQAHVMRRHLEAMSHEAWLAGS